MVSSLFWRYKMKKIRELRADEIEVRVGIVKKNGISLLLYKDARCDMNILDETFGITGWQRKHELINGALFCTVSIKGENGEWISKQDVGVESYTEAVKGAASDSFNVSYISYDENGKVIKSLEIRNQKNEIVCQFNMGNKVSKQASQTANKNQISDYRMGKLYDEMKRTGVTEQQIVERFHVFLANLTERDYKRIMSALKNTDTRAA